MILPMGATHTKHEKLIGIINTIEAQMDVLLRTPPAPSQLQCELMAKYGDERIDNLIIPKYHIVDWVSEEKLDGFSYTCDNGEFFSRVLSQAKETKGQPICKSGHIPHLSQVLRYISALADFDVHGELYKPGGTSDDVTKIMGCTEDKAIARQQFPEDKLHYAIHDIRRFMGHDLTNEPWYVRRAILEYWFDNYISDTHKTFIHISDILHESPRQSFKRIVESGGEGLMLKNTKGLYKPGKKPANNWVKCKKEVTADVIIIGFNEGTGKNKELFGSIQFGVYDDTDGHMIDMGNVSSGLTDEVREMMAKDMDSWIGKVIEITAMAGGHQSFRHPRFKRIRIDKTADQCIGCDDIRINTELI